MDILLVEPKSSTSYPPLGLMKIATYHILQGHNVKYVLGNDKTLRNQFWDHIYITTTFTYDLKQAVETIQFYSTNLFNFKNIQVGGIAATLMPEYIVENTGIRPHIGLLNCQDEFLKSISSNDKRFEYLSTCGYSIDVLPPDYGIFPQDNKYTKILDSSYFLYSTKGCPNKCAFCAVKKLEPNFVPYIPIKPRVEYIRDNFGPKNGLVFLDNNVVYSSCYNRIIDEIIELGFGRDSIFKYVANNRTISKKHFVDFNQGVDARKINEKKMKLMASIAIKPLRLAFDNINDRENYIAKMRMAIKFGVKDLSNYMLYNENDAPDDLYLRMLINTELKEEFPDIRIFSFPMRYSPVDKIDRKHIGEHWTERQVKAIQSILNATHGIVSHNPSFFYRAFGRTIDEYNQLLLMPYHYILNRDFFEKFYNGIQLWKAIYCQMSPSEHSDFLNIVGSRQHINTYSKLIRDLLTLYHDEGRHVIPKDQWANKRDHYSLIYKRLHAKYKINI